MGYTKTIQSGNLIEVYEYEKELYIPHKPRRQRQKTQNHYMFGDVAPIRKRRNSNIARTRQTYTRIIYANSNGNQVPSLSTLTFASEVELERGYKIFNLYIKRLRIKFGSEFRYICTPEFGTKRTKRLHMHVLYWGLPRSYIVNERKTRILAKIWGKGFIDIKLTDNSPKLASYLSKYLTKTLADGRIGSNKAYTTSRNCKRPNTYKNTKILQNYSKEIWDIDLSTVKPLQELNFSTEWLGEGNYKKYYIK